MRLREYGEDAAPVRAKLRTYLAATITDTWRNELRPAGVYPTFENTVSIEREPLGALLLDVDVAIRKLDPADHYHRRIAGLLQARMTEMLARRQLLIETVHETVSWPLLVGMTTWFVVVFAVFGAFRPAMPWSMRRSCFALFPSGPPSSLSSNSTRRSTASLPCRTSRLATHCDISVRRDGAARVGCWDGTV